MYVRVSETMNAINVYYCGNVRAQSTWNTKGKVTQPRQRE
jgi:hypothetical protein